MDVNSFIIYLHELRNQCLYTHSALNIFNQSLQQNSQTGVLFAGQAALSSASQVGAILWPTRARARRRGEALREKLSLPDSHALGDRRFVELWEHSDEKLDDWVKATKGDRVLFDFVGDPKTINLPGLKENGIYRLYDTTNRVFVFRGTGYNMENLAKAIEEIGRRTELLQNQIMERAKAAQDAGRAEEPANNDTIPDDVKITVEDGAAVEPPKADNDVKEEKSAGSSETDDKPKTAKKTAAKKPAAKKETAKKPATKKAATGKKTTTKKSGTAAKKDA